jgi:hypothetical protein
MKEKSHSTPAGENMKARSTHAVNLTIMQLKRAIPFYTSGLYIIMKEVPM